MLNNEVFTQSRVSMGGQSKCNYDLEFLFCPNLLVTKPVFNSMMDVYCNYMIIGSYGVGKTVSMILFAQLSDFVNQFIFEAASDPVKQQ